MMASTLSLIVCSPLEVTCDHLLGCVRKGEHGVRVHTWIEMTKKDDAGENQTIGKRPKMTTVFHISQTDPVKGA